MGDDFELKSDSEEDGCNICYDGFVPEKTYSKLEKIDATINPEVFYTNYIKKRKPVIILGLVEFYKDEFQIQKWTNDYLKNKAGNSIVMIEKLEADQQKYGHTVPKVPMKYGEFLDGIMNKNDRCYMTTQDMEKDDKDVDNYGMPAKFCSAPLTQLKADFPLRPTIMGQLVPYLISLWQGLTFSGSSSGLHHDFEDNIYILIRGKKRFRLFPPSCIEHLKTSGKPLKVFQNGLIAYEENETGIVTVRSDGVPLYFLAKLRVKDTEAQLEKKKKELECIKKSRESVKTRKVKVTELKKEIKRLENDLEEAIQDVMIYGDDGKEDFNDEEEEDGKKIYDNIGSEEKRVQNSIPVPNHFCNIDLPLNSNNPEEIFKSIDAKKDARDLKCLVAELEEGDSLYLPTSWFHEVTSFSVSGLDHLALNYWFYPPDGTCFTYPYGCNFWSKRFETISKNHEI